MDHEEFVRLEQLVDTLIDNYNGLREKLHILEEKLRNREEECRALKEELVELQEQRSEVGRRVAGLLGRIELWESEQGDGAQMTEEKKQEAGSRKERSLRCGRS